MFPVLQVGRLAIQVPGLVLLAGIWIGLLLTERYAGYFQIHPDRLYNLVLVSMLGGVIGARLAYAARYPQPFVSRPLDLLSLNPGLLDPAGGIAIALIIALILVQRNRLPYGRTLDALVPLFAVFQIAVSISNLASGRAYGLPADIPWGLTIYGAVRHPSQIYNLVAAAGVLWLLWPKRTSLAALIPGEYFLQFWTVSAIITLFLDGFRADSPILPNGIRIIQLAAWIAAGGGLLYWYYIRKSKRSVQDG